MPMHFRRYTRGTWGKLLVEMPISGVTPTSVVNVTAVEATGRGAASHPGAGGSIQNYDSFVGSAVISVSNICPFHGGVRWYLHVNYERPLNVAQTITVYDEKAHIMD